MQRRNHRVAVYLVAAILGAIVGIFVLFPANEFLYYHEYEPEASSGLSFALGQVRDTLAGRTPWRAVFYAGIGTVLGLMTRRIIGSLQTRSARIELLSSELERDVVALVAQGEGPSLEFKSSFRWDYKQSAINRSLEGVVLKTLAGFMNAHGGSLLIGVAEDGEIIGLDKDYQTLKKPDRDGFEQSIMTAVAVNLGANLCQFIQVVFHYAEGRDVCRVIVNPSPIPAYVKQGHETKFYVRTGGSTRELNIQEAMQYESHRSRK